MLYSPGIAERNVTGYCSRPIEGVTVILSLW